ncbi:MAG TPA: sigma-70 family RNA polymerase sigma factor [Thermoanaerobaculia bacterium]|jgi:RNA polymerase sigma-70 factor (ECF subfamily)
MTRRPSQERFLTLLDEHKKILYKVAGSYCRNPEDRRDLEQEIVAQLWRSFDRYDESYKFSTWMYRIALNVAISFSRSETRRSRHTVPAGESILEIADVRETAETDAGLQILRRLIAQLDELDRALILLYLDGNRYDTIAEILGISETNVGTKIGRIKARLRRDAATL